MTRLKHFGFMAKITRNAATYTEKIDPIQEALLNEQCILVNEKDHILGKASKRECHELDSHGKSKLHRAFSLFVFNSKRELLLQQRSDSKVTFPGLWTNTCCSHPLAVPEEMDPQNGIGAKRAAQRRIANELGVTPEQCKIEDMAFVTRILYAAPSSGGRWGEHELDYILFLQADMDLKPNPNEVKDVAFVAKDRLQAFVDDKAKKLEGITPWFSLIVESMLPLWWENLDSLDRFKDHESIKRFT